MLQTKHIIFYAYRRKIISAKKKMYATTSKVSELGNMEPIYLNRKKA